MKKTYQIKGFKIILSETVISVFEAYVQNTSEKNEAGGVLLGQVRNNTIYVTRASIPNEFDKASRYEFIRNKKVAQIIMDYEYINSRKRTIYLGEWHTHPDNNPTPSGQDRRMIKEQWKFGQVHIPFVLLIIQGIKSLYFASYDGKRFTKGILIDE